MAKKTKFKSISSSGKDVGFEMTPMIDIVFQLIIFFMVSLAFTESQVEARLTLPAADAAKPPESIEQDMFTFNVVDVTRPGANFATPFIISAVHVTEEELLSRLKDEAELSRSASARNKVERGIIIRGDKDTAWAYILVAMKRCQEAGFTKVYLQAMEKSLEEQVNEEHSPQTP